MTLQELFKTIDRLSPAERAQLRDYIDRHDTEHTQLKTGTMDVDVLLEAVRSIRADMDEAEFEAMLDAMNEEYIEPVDDDGWPQ